MAVLHRAATNLLHSNEPDSPPWKYLPLVLVLAFAVRAALALSGDFLLHPDEIMQYLEPAHRLVFGNGAMYWEYFYGARSWLLPGLIAGVLWLFDLLGLGTPFWYVGGVKLVFCAISLAVPAGMYFFARRHFGELSARVALLAGAFWYELAGFAHKPMSEFVATASLIALLALCVHPAVGRKADSRRRGDDDNRELDGGGATPDSAWMLWSVAALAVLTAALRMQYAPLALLLLGVVFFRSDRKRQLTLAAAVCVLAVGVFDAVTWGGGLFHSYLTNLRFNVNHPFATLPYPMPAYQYVWWLLLAGGGLSVLSLVGGGSNLRRYGLLLALLAVLLLAHSLQPHKEYRFIFVALPLWLLIGADLVATLGARVRAIYGDGRRLTAAAVVVAVVFGAISGAGILNALPYQEQIYRTPFIAHNDFTKFIPALHPATSLTQLFAVYRYLAAAPGVAAVWVPHHKYSATPGYYYLHRKVPLYDYESGPLIGKDLTTLRASVSHIVSANPEFAVPGYALVKTFGTLRILQRNDAEPVIRRWQEYIPHYIDAGVRQTLQQSGGNWRSPPPDWGIRFVK